MKRDRIDDVIEGLLSDRAESGTQFDARDIEEEAFRTGRGMGIFAFLKSGEGIDPAEWAMEVIKSKRRSATSAKVRRKGTPVRKYHYLSSTGLWIAREALDRNQLMTVIRDYESQGAAIDARREGLYQMVSDLDELAQKLDVSVEELRVGDIETDSEGSSEVVSDSGAAA